MSTFHDSMWAEASRDHAAESHERAVALSSVALAGLVPFLHAASSIEEYDQRLALVADRAEELLAAHTPDTLAHTAALAQVRADFETLHMGRVAARLSEAARKAPTDTARCAACNERLEKVDGGWRHTEYYQGKGFTRSHEAHPAKGSVKEAGLQATAASSDLDDMIAWEEGSLDEEGTVALFQRLIDTGMAWRLQGAYGRQAQALIDAGLCHQPGRGASLQATAATTECAYCGNPITKRKDPSGQRGEAWAESDSPGHMSDTYDPATGTSTNGPVKIEDWDFQCGLSPDGQHHPASEKTSAIKTGSINLTNVGIVDRAGLVCKGTDPSGKEVKFKVTPSEMDQLASVLFGDLAQNFSGVSIEPEDIVKDAAAKTAAADDDTDDAKGTEKCWDCGGTGKVPDMGGGEDGYEDCPTCGGTGTLAKTGARVAVVPPFGGEVHVATAKESLEDLIASLTDDEVLEAEALLSSEAIGARENTSHAASLRRVATVKCAKCTAGSTPDGADCGYCDGAGSLDPTMAMIKAADGWEQGITAESFLVAAGQPASVSDHPAEPEWETSTSSDLCKTCGWPVEKNKRGDWVHEAKNPTQWSDKRTAVAEDAKGSDRYQQTAHPSEPGWVEDEWDTGEADKATLDTGRAGKDRGLPKGMEKAATRKVADLAALTRRLERLSGHAVDLNFTSDWGVDRVRGTLSFADGNATVTARNGQVTSVPVHHVLGVETTGYSEADPGAGTVGREPSILDLIGTGFGNGLIPSGATAARTVVANPYAANPYEVDGPGNPNSTPAAPTPAAEAPVVTPPPADPKTTRPRVAPQSGGGAYDPENYPSSTSNPTHRVGPVDRSADTVVVEDHSGSRESTAAQIRARFTTPPQRTAHETKVGAITASVLTANPGMGVEAARKVAEATVARYAGVVGF